MKKIAIIIVCYNRLNGVKRLCKSLLNANYCSRNDITLIFSIDKSGILDIVQFANSFIWPFGEKIIREFKIRQGLKQHILQCGDLTNVYDAVIVLEDDIIVSNCFFAYASQAIDFYWEDTKVAGISLYSFQKNWLRWPMRFEPYKSIYDSFFMKIAQSWGEVWTRPQWLAFRKWLKDNPEILQSDEIPNYLKEWPKSSWLKFYTKYCIINNRYFTYPYYSLSTNCSDAGTHANRTTNDHQVTLQFDKEKYLFPVLNDNAVLYDEYMNRMRLGKYIGIQDNMLSVDFYGTRNQNHHRYLLSTQKLDFHVIKQYQLSLRPIEASIIWNYEGDGIYLYDTSLKAKNRNRCDDYDLQLYSLRSHDFRYFLTLSIKLMIKEIKSKFNRMLKK